MQNTQQPNELWVPCDSRNALVAQFPESASNLLMTEDPNSWGYMVVDQGLSIPIGYANAGLIPSVAKYENRTFIGIDELLACYDLSGRSLMFKYKMPTIFHEFVRFDQNEFIVRDEIGFVGISYAGNERWNFCVNVIANYRIDQGMIIGETEEGEIFEFTIPSAESSSSLS